MAKTGAEFLMDLGELRGLRRMLLLLLQARFGKIPAAVVARVRSESSIRRLRQWLCNFVGSHKLEQIGIQ